MSKLVILLIAATLVAAYCNELALRQNWQSFKTNYRKAYSHELDAKRFQVYKTNLARAQLYQQKNPQATYGETVFSDLTPEEFSSLYFGLNRTSKYLGASETERNVYKPQLKEIPAAWDWVEKGAVTGVKNQGSCGSCWAFSTTQNIEGQYFLKHGELAILSEQQLVDCDKVDQGCNGGLMQDAMQWLAEHGGLATESDYPYTGSDDECKFNSTMAKVNVTGFRNISTNETEIAQSLVELGPLAIAVVADPWQFYIAGIADPWFCNGELDHGVLLVGYGHGWGLIAEADFWRVKNSWGTWWGESGYIRLVRGTGVCGMNQDVSTATIA